MQNLLVLCLLANFIASGASLLCEICKGSGHLCEGTLHPCPPGSYSCSIVQTESTLASLWAFPVSIPVHTGRLSKFFEKTCIPARYCDQGTFILNLGRFGTAMVRPICCKRNNCSKVPPPVPPINTVPNGKTCPACYSVHSLNCKEEIAQCAGDEIYCIEIAGTVTVGETTVTTVMKGCANAAPCNYTLPTSDLYGRLDAAITTKCPLASETATCNDTFRRSDSFRGISIGVTTECTLASRAASSIPELIRLYFQASTGILLVKILS